MLHSTDNPGRPGRPFVSPRQRRGLKGAIAVGFVACLIALAGYALALASSSPMATTAATQSLLHRPFRVGGLVLPRLGHPREEVALASAEGPVTFVNFFASWCTVCKQEAPALAAASRRLAGRATFVGVDVGDSSSAATRFVARFHLHYLVLTISSARAAGLGIIGLPETVILSRDGTVLGEELGAMSEEAALALWRRAGASG